jgi:hypothetical protein
MLSSLQALPKSFISKAITVDRPLSRYFELRDLLIRNQVSNSKREAKHLGMGTYHVVRTIQETTEKRGKRGRAPWKC